MNELRQSDGGVIPEKFPNVPEPTGTEGMEERPPAQGNELQGPLYRTQSRESMGVALERIRLASDGNGRVNSRRSTITSTTSTSCAKRISV